MEELIEVLKSVKPGYDFTEDTELIKNKVFDSLAMIQSFLMNLMLKSRQRTLCRKILNR